MALGRRRKFRTGYYVGKQWFDEITARVQRYCLVGFIASLVMSVSLLLAAIHYRWLA